MQIIIDSEDIVTLVNHHVKLNREINEDDLSRFLDVIEEFTSEPDFDLEDLKIEKPNDLIPPELDTRFWNNDFINRIKRNN